MLSPELAGRLRAWKTDRQRARTDLLFLCNEVLHYRDVSPRVHQPILDSLQTLAGGTDHTSDQNGALAAYVPACSIWELTGPRKRLILYPRGHLKTTIVAIAHAIQWILNYPDIRILISTAIGEQALKIVSEIKAHFQFNPHFRFLFPEFCPPPKRAGDWGTQDGFTVPCRSRKWLKEPTLSVCSVGKVIAGAHYEVIIHSDLVDKENVKTPNQIRDVIQHFGYMNPLLERGPVAPYHGWTIVEGTRYDFGDLYGTIIDSEEEKQEREWLILKRAAYQDDGTALWPERFPPAELENIKNDRTVGVEIFSANYLNEPVSKSGGLATLEQCQWFPRELVSKIPLRYHVTVDLHGMEASADNDFTVLTVAGFDRDGRMYVVEIRRGRFSPFEVIEQIFDLHRRYPSADFKIEKDAHARVLLPFLEREKSKRQQFPVFVPIRRDSRVSKVQRIRGLQPWFQSGNIRFVSDLAYRVEMVQEITRFPKFSHDDILDTLADQLQNAEGQAANDVYPDMTPRQDIPARSVSPVGHFLGFEPGTGRERWSDDPASAPAGSYWEKTGL